MFRSEPCSQLTKATIFHSRKAASRNQKMQQEAGTESNLAANRACIVAEAKEDGESFSV